MTLSLYIVPIVHIDTGNGTEFAAPKYFWGRLTEGAAELQGVTWAWQRYVWENHGFIKPLRKYSNSSLATYPEFDSTSIIATAGSKEAGRGDTYTDFHGSEVAFWPDAEKIIAGAMQGGSPDVILRARQTAHRGISSTAVWRAWTVRRSGNSTSIRGGGITVTAYRWNLAK